MKRFLIGASLAGMLAAATPALADGKIYVQLPDLSGITGTQAEDFLQQVVLANIVSSNCTGYEVSEEEWSLLTDSADILSHQMGLTTDEYVEKYETPAFKALDEAGICEDQGPHVQPILDELVALGGSREALPDQEAAYTEWRAMQDYWDAGGVGMPPAAGSTGKSKTK